LVNVPLPKEKWSGAIGRVVLGDGSVVAGGAKGMPFLSFEDPEPPCPLIAGEVVDHLEDFPPIAKNQFSKCAENPIEWSLRWKELGADLICLRLLSTDPEKGNKGPDYAATLAKEIVDATDMPLIVYGCGITERDYTTLEAVGTALKGNRCLLAHADEDSYKRVSASAIANKHAVVAFSNLDINLAKQMNILLSDFGVDRKDIVMDPLMAALGMGLEYSYSVNERIRLAALSGDRMLQMPMVCDASQAWQVRDCYEEADDLGDPVERATWWEFATALASLLSGADILIMRGANAMLLIKEAIDELRGVV